MGSLKSSEDKLPIFSRFILAGCAGMSSTAICHPLDVLKVRLQMNGEGGSKPLYNSYVHAIKTIKTTEGLFVLYNGLSAGLLRQATYTLTRLGVYTSLLEYHKKHYDTIILPTQMLFAGFSGFLAGLVGTPSEIVLIRMTSDGRLPQNVQFKYKHVFNGLNRIYHEESFSMLFRGVIPTVVRTTITNSIQLVAYSRFKEIFIRNGICEDNILCHSFSSMISGCLTACITCPVDVIKTRLQNLSNTDHDKRGILRNIRLILKTEGILAFWKGSAAFALRMGPHTVLLFVFFEQYTKIYRQYIS